MGIQTGEARTETHSSTSKGTPITSGQLADIVAASFVAASKAWHPDNPAYLPEAAMWLNTLQRSEPDPMVARTLRRIARRVKQAAPEH